MVMRSEAKTKSSFPLLPLHSFLLPSLLTPLLSTTTFTDPALAAAASPSSTSTFLIAVKEEEGGKVDAFGDLEQELATAGFLDGKEEQESDTASSRKER